MPNKKSFFCLSIVEPQPIFEDASPQHECKVNGASAFFALTDFLLSKTKTAPTLTKKE